MDENYIHIPIMIQVLLEMEESMLDELTLYRPSDSDELTEESIIYLDDEQINVDEETYEEIYPQFVLENNLDFYFYGQTASDIIKNTRMQLQKPTIKDFLFNFNYYDSNDCFFKVK